MHVLINLDCVTPEGLIVHVHCTIIILAVFQQYLVMQCLVRYTYSTDQMQGISLTHLSLAMNAFDAFDKCLLLGTNVFIAESKCI